MLEMGLDSFEISALFSIWGENKLKIPQINLKRSTMIAEKSKINFLSANIHANSETQSVLIQNSQEKHSL